MKKLFLLIVLVCAFIAQGCKSKADEYADQQIQMIKNHGQQMTSEQERVLHDAFKSAYQVDELGQRNR